MTIHGASGTKAGRSGQMGGKMSKIRQVHKAGRQRNLWLVSGSVLAAATASVLMPGQVFAQQIHGGTAGSSAPIASGPPVAVITTTSSTTAPANGDTNTAGSNVAASANYFASEVDFRPGTALDEVELFAASAIINWTTSNPGTAGGQVTFLGAGQRLNFTSALNDYTVLNRIFTPTIDAAVRIDGTVTSNTLSGSGQGGNIWLYSPGGLIIGASSIFNVGSLVLTSSNLNSIGSTMDFTGVAEANTAVVIESGAQISALAQNSYFAVVAPRVEQGGSVNVNGSVAYVGAEQAQLTINGGLFDISVGLGSADANGVVHTGTTTGPAASPVLGGVGEIIDADARGIYMVAVPKNTAISMLVGGTIGYQPAVAASLGDNGSIILSAGAGIAATGDVTTAAAQVDVANAAAGGNVVLDSVNFTSSAEVYASDSVTLAPGAASAISAGSDGRGGYDLSVTAGGGIALSLAGSAAISVDGDLTLKSGGDIDVDLTAAAGTMFVGGNFVLDTQTREADDFFTVLNNGGTGIGAGAVSGAINLTVGGGTSLDVGSNLVLNSAAQGGKGELQNGLATAGDIAVDFSTTGTIDIGGQMLISAEAISAQTGKIAGNGPGGIGSDSTGGNITVNLNTGGLNAGGLMVNASAEASGGDNSAIAQSNDAIAGAVTVNILGGFNQLGQIDLTSRADGAASFDPGGAVAVGQVTRGSASLTVTGPDAALAVTGDVSIDVSTDGAPTAPTTNTVSITVDNAGPMGGMFVGGSLRIDTTAGGGSIAGVTTAGSVLLQAADGELSAGFLDISARASESGRNFSFDGSGQDFQGGDVTLRAGANGLMNFGFAFIDTAATGAVNSAGDAIGGSIALEANDGAIQFQSFGSLNADASGGSGADPVDGGTAAAQGGNISVSLSGTAGSMDLADLFIRADASILFDVESGSIDFSGDGGSAVAGNVVFDLNGGSLSANSMSISSQGTGGDGGILPPAFAPFATGLPSAGNGGSGQGGTITFNLDGGDITVGDLNILADGIGGEGAFGSFTDGTRAGSGGDAVGGTAVFNAFSGSLSAASITIAARGNTVNGGGSGGSAAGSEGGNGGNATGGSATFNLDGTAAISSGAVVVSADGFGGAGGDSFATIDAFSNALASQAAGSGGSGTGGAATFNNTSGIISFTGLTASAAGIGGNGGTSSGFSMNDAGGAGGAGGSGIGGIATIDLSQDDASGPAYSVDAGGVGGAGGGGLFSGHGGDAAGGTANLAINNAAIIFSSAAITADALGGDAVFADTAGGTAGSGGSAIGGTANLDVSGAAANVSTSEPLRLSADATGGTGANGPPAAAGGNGGTGGAGGSAAGGAVRIGLTGAGAGLTLNSSLVTLSADADGGQGGTGGASFDADGGTGGLGGNAAGGTLTLEANSGTVLTLDELSGGFSMAATGTGGTGGQGGDGGINAGATSGTGGNGGTGIGGSPTLRAIGGTITGTGTGADLASVGIGGNGGAAGFSQIALGGQGNGGDGQGGNPIIELLDGSPEIITLADVGIVSAGFGGTGAAGGISLGGRIDIRDLSRDAGGNFTFNALRADVIGDIASAGGGFFLSGGSGTNIIAGNQIIGVVGDISYAFDGDGQLVVGGDTQLTATGSILITHTNNAGQVISLGSGGNFTAIAGLDFLASGQSIISSGNVIAVRAEGSAQANDVQALSFIEFSAGLNAAVNNASVTGPAVTANVGAGTIVLNGIDIRAGGNNDPSFEQYDPTYSAAITGNVTSTGFISVTAGGNAVFAAGSATVSDNGLTVRTGDDIIIASGALVEGAANPATTPDTALPFGPFNNLVMDAGALARSGELIAAPLTPIASIVSSGTISANSFAVILNANATGGLGGTINAASLAADIVDAPAAGLPQSDDAGLLSANCLQGTICLGSIAADNRIEVGQNSNNDVIQLIVEQAAISANDVLITIRDDIVMGSNGIPTSINAANNFAVESLTGDVNLLDAVINSNQITIAAAGSLLGTGSLTSANDIGITVGLYLNALLIDSGGQLTTVAGVGGTPEAQYDVPGAVNVGTYTQGGATPLRIIAGADIGFGAINLPGNQDITLIAGNTAAGDITLGSITGGTAFLQAAAGAISVTDDIALAGLLEAAAQSIFLRSTNALTVQAAASAGDIDIQAVGDIDLRGLTAAGNIAVNTAGGSVSVNQAVSAANALSIDAGGIIDLQAAASGAAIDIVASDINVAAAGTLGRSDLTGSIGITTLGDILLGGAGGGSPIGGVMEINNAEFSRIFSGGDLSISAFTGPTGAGGNLTLDTLDVLVGSGAGAPQDGNIGPSSALFLSASASINVIGTAAMTNAGTDSLFSLLAGQGIDVDTVNGAISVQNANGALAGQLELIAPTIRAISDTAAQDIAGAATADIDLRLGQNDGAVIDPGYFSAAALSFTVEDALLIQNSGGGTAFDDRRGFTANSVTIGTANPAAVIVINGTVDGFTGVDALNAASVSGQFDPRSTINGCLILNRFFCGGRPGIDDPGLIDPVRDLIEETIDPRDKDQPGGRAEGVSDSGGILVEIRQPASMREDPLLDDPVTGAGNEDLWISGPDCEGVGAENDACDGPQ